MTITDKSDKLAPIHPGEVLMLDFIEELGITQNKLSVSIRVPPRRINEIVHGKHGISADTALRLAEYFGTSAQFWLNLQSQFDLDVAEDCVAGEINAIAPFGAREPPSAFPPPMRVLPICASAYGRC